MLISPVGKTGIAAALKTELKYLRPTFEGSRHVVLLLTGVGKARTLRILDDYFRGSSFDYLLNIGTAGAISPDLSSGTILLPDSTVDYESLEQHPVNGNFRSTIQDRLTRKGIPFISGVQATVKQGIKDCEERERVREETGGLAVDMESHYVNSWARARGIPIAILRIVTDNADENAMLAFKSYLHIASRKLAEIVVQLNFSAWIIRREERRRPSAHKVLSTGCFGRTESRGKHECSFVTDE